MTAEEKLLVENDDELEAGLDPSPRRPIVNWLKLVGSTGDPIAEDWAHKEAHNFTEISFPWNKPPRL